MYGVNKVTYYDHHLMLFLFDICTKNIIHRVRNTSVITYVFVLCTICQTTTLSVVFSDITKASVFWDAFGIVQYQIAQATKCCILLINSQFASQHNKIYYICMMQNAIIKAKCIFKAIRIVNVFIPCTPQSYHVSYGKL